MEQLILQINDFCNNIYFNMAPKMKEDYLFICTRFSDEIDRSFIENKAIIQQKNALLSELLNGLESNDFLRMSITLEEKVLKWLNELSKLEI